MDKRKDIQEVVDYMDAQCHMLYNEAFDILKSKGMTDEEIFATNLHLRANSTNAMAGRVRRILLDSIII